MSAQFLPLNVRWIRCFLHAALKFGLLAGGGMGDVLQPEVYRSDAIFAWRFVFDIAFFILVTVIIMNLVLGIIVDVGVMHFTPCTK